MTLENLNQIHLSFDMKDLKFINGDAKVIHKFNKDDYATTIFLALPTDRGKFKEGDFEVESKSHLIYVKIFKVENQTQDPIFNATKNIEIGTSGTGIPTLPFEVFTDNKGKYPYYCAAIVFPYLLAEWSDSNHPSGIKMDYDYKKLRITGGVEDEAKIEALVILNDLFSSEDYGLKEKPLFYDDVTVFLENYFLQGQTKPILQKINVLSSKNAYKDAITEYFIEPKIKDSITDLVNESSNIDIKCESDLLNFVMTFINDVIIHHIENRRWTTAFWDGSRKIKENGSDIKIPAQPKNEVDIQPTLHVLFYEGLNPLGIHVSRETDEGIGSLDFKFAYTTSEKIGISVCVEFKLAHHKRIKHGISRQLPSYLKANRSSSGLYIVMWFKDEDGKYFDEPSNRTKESMLEFIENEAERINNEENLQIKTIMIDASIKPSASYL